MFIFRDKFDILVPKFHKGTNPVEIFVRTQIAKKDQVKVEKKFQLYEERGFAECVRVKNIKWLRKKDNLLEVIMDVGHLSLRFLGFKISQHVYLVHAFKKKTQKTPPREIKQALGKKNNFVMYPYENH